MINKYCEVVDPDCLIEQLKNLKSIGIDGVMVDCWWGIVEPHAPQQYNWKGYTRLFDIVRDLKLKLKVTFFFLFSLPLITYNDLDIRVFHLFL